MLDFDLAKIYGYKTKYLNRQVQRNIDKFPNDFMFELSETETNHILRCQNVTANHLSSKTRYNPCAFTEQGIYMLMTVLKGELAVKQSKALIRLFKQMKDYIVNNNSIESINEILRLSQQVKNNSESIKELQNSNIDMKNQLEVVMDNFINPSTYKHFLILNGEKIEADLAFQTIYSLAKHSIILIDDYVDIKTLWLLKACSLDIKITLFTDNVSKNGLNDQLVNEFIEETNLKITLRPTNGVFHDRYIVVDYKTDKERIFHSGPSSKDAGNKICTIMMVEKPLVYHSIIDEMMR